ncbi:MAG: hypothetical protein Q9208_008010 [Pyrenodesmia sp. 3 TL-2023]
MRTSFSIIFFLAMAIFLSGTNAKRKDNCKGSGMEPNVPDCRYGLLAIDPLALYSNLQEFSPGHCMIQYRTDDTGPHPIPGAIIRDTAQRILLECARHRGSFYTGNCEECHVTVNYKM